MSCQIESIHNNISMKKKTELPVYFIVIATALGTLLASGCRKDVDDDPDAIKDGDGNVYTTVAIGTQIWLLENLKTTKYNDGTDIPLVTDDVTWEGLTTPAYSWYNNNENANKDNYGALYNWYAVNTGKLCPAGWHVPADSEWTELYTFLGGDAEASGKLRESGTSHWSSPNTGASNSSGFKALPGGFRQVNGTFTKLGEYGVWWSSTPDNSDPLFVRERYLVYNINYAYIGADRKEHGFSVRCMKN
jgi:uncharacterized protein (TIGR02145 family)